MKEFAKIVESFDEEKKKQLFADLTEVSTVEGIMTVGNNYNLNITKEQATEMFDELKDARKMTNEELSKMVSGGKFIGILYCIWE